MKKKELEKLELEKLKFAKEIIEATSNLVKQLKQFKQSPIEEFASGGVVFNPENKPREIMANPNMGKDLELLQRIEKLEKIVLSQEEPEETLTYSIQADGKDIVKLSELEYKELCNYINDNTIETKDVEPKYSIDHRGGDWCIDFNCAYVGEFECKEIAQKVCDLLNKE